jgi:flagellar biosynthesis protein FlhF
VLLEMRREMESMRRMVQNEFSVMGWGEMGRRNPVMQDLFRRLMGLELSADLCHGLVKKVEKIDDPEQAWRKALAILAASLPVYGRDVMEEGGVIAFIGPTGVGKTTTIAKLAARYCLRHGNRHVGLITADSYRVGGHDQIGVYARLLDVPLRSVSSTRELEAALNAMTDKRLVLIDTAGMSQRDPRLKEQLAFLASERKSIRRFLTLSTTTQQSALEQAILGFSDGRPEACILTKVDEAASLGGAFSALIRHGLPLTFITDGQKVPEDMHLPRSQALVNRAVNMSQQYAIAQSEQYLALAFGGSGADARI